MIDGIPWKSKCGNYHVVVATTCLEKIFAVAKGYDPYEIGSSLVGSYSEDGYKAFILDIAPIPKDSISTDSSFLRGQNTGDFFEETEKQYKGHRHYVGEWHSHPNMPAIPSDVDDGTQNAIAFDEDTNCPESILLIVGGELSKAPKVGVYIYSRVDGKIELHRIKSQARD